MRYSWIVWSELGCLPVRFVEQRPQRRRRPCAPRRIPLRCTGCSTHPFDLQHCFMSLFHVLIMRLWWRPKGMIMRLKIENYLPHSSLSRICSTSPINLKHVQPKQIHIRVSLSGWGCLLWACAKIREMLESIIRLTAKYQNGVAVISQRTFSFVC